MDNPKDWKRLDAFTDDGHAGLVKQCNPSYSKGVVLNKGNQVVLSEDEAVNLTLWLVQHGYHRPQA